MANLEEHPTPRFRRGNDPAPPTPAPTDELEALEVEAGLPEPSPLTEERAQRLEVIKARVIEIYPRYKKYARRMHTVMVELGQLLIEAKGIVGRGRFMTWVNENMPFCHSTADNYMKLMRDLKFTTFTNLAEQGTADAVEAHFAKKSEAQSRKWRQEEKAERRAKLPQSPLQLKRQRKRQRKFARFRENRMFNHQQHQAAQQVRSEEYLAKGLTDLTKTWSRPHVDCQRMEIELELPDETIRVIYVWLPEDSHMTAGAEAALVSAGRWKGALALRYRWLVVTKSKLHVPPWFHRVDRVETNNVTPARIESGSTWEAVQAELVEQSRDAIEVRRAEVMDRDPAAVGILDNWHLQGNFKRPKSIAVLD